MDPALPSPSTSKESRVLKAPEWKIIQDCKNRDFFLLHIGFRIPKSGRIHFRALFYGIKLKAGYHLLKDSTTIDRWEARYYTFRKQAGRLVEQREDWKDIVNSIIWLRSCQPCLETAPGSHKKQITSIRVIKKRASVAIKAEWQSKNQAWLAGVLGRPTILEYHLNEDEDVIVPHAAPLEHAEIRGEETLSAVVTKFNGTITGSDEEYFFVKVRKTAGTATGSGGNGCHVSHADDQMSSTGENRLHDEVKEPSANGTEWDDEKKQSLRSSHFMHSKEAQLMEGFMKELRNFSV